MSGGSLYISIADLAASVLLFKRAFMVNLDCPVSESRLGRWATEAQEVTAEDDSPMSAVRKGSVLVAIAVEDNPWA